MHSHHETQHSPYTPEQLFAMVVDIEEYPKFLPWCRAARILERKENEFLGELVISFAHLTESYVSRVSLAPHSGVDVSLVRGPFKQLSNSWRFTPKPGGGTQIDFSLSFEFRTKLLEKLIGALFGRATAKMVSAFKARADVLYGTRP
ncbi:MAG: type II toxin-antitoxin system RatA family toxin [Rickettsiales bacterium]|jgi:coenzyme Q-binding protein COQ10|nr:type II toxin-antitoxin system RatA family toxin [Rickettsiales bacterium]